MYWSPMKRKRRFYPGQPVLIVRDLRDNPTATDLEAVYEGYHDIRTGRRYRGSKREQSGNMFRYMPRLRLLDGTHIWGFECYWIPMKEAQLAWKAAGIDRRPYAEQKLTEELEDIYDIGDA